MSPPLIRQSATLLALLLPLAGHAGAADFVFHGRSGDAIELDFASLPGVPAGATFSDLTLGFGSVHTLLASDALTQGAFATGGRAWAFANPAFDTPAQGDADPDARGFQGAIDGTLKVNGQTKTFRVAVAAGHSGAGRGAVQQDFERLGRPANNPLHVAQQQQRLRYLGFRRQGGGAVSVTGQFDNGADQALQTFQAAFDGGVNATQTNSSEADGIVGPTSAAWLNAANAPTWDELIDPDPQVPGTFSVGSMIGDFDILPSPDPGGGGRTGNTPQSERFGTSWAIELFTAGAAAAKQATGITQLMNGMSTVDGYGSAAFHSTHRVGMDIDIHVDYSTWNFGNGVVSDAEQQMIDQALAFVNAPGTTGVTRILASNADIVAGINAQAPGVAVYDGSGGHQNHLHIDVGTPSRIADLADLPGDFNLNDRVDAADYVVWRQGFGSTFTRDDFDTWAENYGSVQPTGGFAVAVPEPTAAWLASLAAAAGWLRSRAG